MRMLHLKRLVSLNHEFRGLLPHLSFVRSLLWRLQHRGLMILIPGPWPGKAHCTKLMWQIRPTRWCEARVNRSRGGGLGFTLIELLVVITIIGILATLGAVSYSTAQRRGRDARRIGDMKAISNAQEQYFAANDDYEFVGGCGVTGFVANLQDPKNVLPYQYSCQTNASNKDFCACAVLESGDGNAAAMGSCTCGAGGCSIFAGTGAYCVVGLQ